MKKNFLLILSASVSINLFCQTTPDYFIREFNYYFEKSNKSIINIGPSKGNSGFKITDSTGKTAGYISESQSFDKKMMDSGFYFIDQGIMRYPERLDMRFGKVYALQSFRKFDLFAGEINKTIEYSDSIKNIWLWKDHKPLEDPVKFFLGTIQQYVIQLYEEGDEYLPLMRSIAETVLKYHPDDVRFLTDLSITYSITKDHSKAIEPLLKAEKIAPHDFIILNNIALNYFYLGDKENAIKYYELTIKYGDEEAKTQAKEKIKELKNK